jgi:phospholipid transport system substrate-binding protein
MGTRRPVPERRAGGDFALEVSRLRTTSPAPAGRLPVLVAALWIGLAPAGGWAADPAAAAAPDPGARAPVEALQAVLLECMKGACGPSFEERYQHIFAELDKSFDLAFMARVSLGNAWNSLSADQRTAFVALSRRFSAASYAANFDGYDGQRFEIRGEEPAGRGTLLIKTELVQPHDDDVSFDYRLRQTDGGWRIIDITLDGKISQLTLRRSEYASVVEHEGFPKLVEVIEAKIAKLAKK